MTVPEEYRDYFFKKTNLTQARIFFKKVKKLNIGSTKRLRSRLKGAKGVFIDSAVSAIDYNEEIDRMVFEEVLSSLIVETYTKISAN